MASSDNVKNNDYDKNQEVSETNENIKDLLESALDDFDTVKEKELTNRKQDFKKDEGSKNSTAEDLPFDPAMNQVYEELFKEFNTLQVNQPPTSSSSNHSTQSSSQLPQLSSLLLPPSSKPSLLQPSSSQQTFSNPMSDNGTFSIPDDVSKSLQDALKSLNEFNTSESNSGGLSEKDLADLMEEMSKGGGMGDGGAPENMMPLMQNMMQNLLSKEMLYASLKDISTKYPAWIEEREGSLDEADMQRYKEQYRLMSAMVLQYEQEQPADSQEVKNKRFEHLLDLMQNMQQLGQPPKEIAGDLGGMELDEMGFPKMMDGSIPNPNQCSIS